MKAYKIVNCDGKAVNGNVYSNHDAVVLEIETMLTMKSVYSDMMKYRDGLWIETIEA